MATKKLLRDFTQQALNETQSEAVKGGRSYVPGSTGSTGYINWDDVEIREPGLLVATNPVSVLNPGRRPG